MEMQTCKGCLIPKAFIYSNITNGQYPLPKSRWQLSLGGPLHGFMLYTSCAFLDQEPLLTATYLPVTSRMDSCNAMYMELPLKSIWMLQLVKNRVTKAVMYAPRMAHIIPLLCKLHWLQVCFHGQFMVLAFMAWGRVICRTTSP